MVVWYGLIDKFDPDRERWSSYLMHAEFYFDSNNRPDEKGCSMFKEVTDVSYEEVKAAIKQH